MTDRRYEMTWGLLMLPVLIWRGAVVPVLRAQTMVVHLHTSGRRKTAGG